MEIRTYVYSRDEYDDAPDGWYVTYPLMNDHPKTATFRGPYPTREAAEERRDSDPVAKGIRGKGRAFHLWMEHELTDDGDVTDEGYETCWRCHKKPEDY